MRSVFVTNENIRFLKRALREELVGVKSGHITEALAQGVGYKTQAAMLADVNSTHPFRPILRHLCTYKIANGLSKFGYLSDPMKLADMLPATNELPDRAWVQYNNGNQSKHEKWYYHCQRRSMPFMYVETRRKYSRLNWDCITIDPSEEAHVRGHAGDDLTKKMFRTFQAAAKGAQGKPFFEASAFVGHIDNLTPDLMCELASSIFTMLYAPLSQPATKDLPKSA